MARNSETYSGRFGFKPTANESEIKRLLWQNAYRATGDWSHVTHNSYKSGGVDYAISSVFQKRMDDPNTSDEYKEALKKEKDEFDKHGGLCFGFSIMNSVMHLQGKGNWWRAALACLCDQEHLNDDTVVHLPDSDGPIRFGDLFEKVVSALFQCQRLGEFKGDEGPLMNGVSKQADIFHHLEISESENVELNCSESKEGTLPSFDEQIRKALAKLSEPCTRNRKILIKNNIGHVLAEVTYVSNPLLDGDADVEEEEVKGAALATGNGQFRIFIPEDGSRINSPGRSEFVSDGINACLHKINERISQEEGAAAQREANDVLVELSEEKCLYCPEDEIKIGAEIDLTEENLIQALQALQHDNLLSNKASIIKISLRNYCRAGWCHAVSIRVILDEASEVSGYAFYDSNKQGETICENLDNVAEHIYGTYDSNSSGNYKYTKFLFTAAPLVVKPKEWTVESINALIEEARNNHLILNRVDQNGDTPLLWAINNNDDARIELLKNADVDREATWYIATSKGKVQAIAALIELGVQLDSNNNKGEILLCRAAKERNISAIRALLEVGVNADFAGTNIPGQTALSLAAYFGYADVIRLLVKPDRVNRADPNSRVDQGVTPLYWAAVYGHLEAVNALLAAGAHVNAIHEASGVSPVYTAACYGHHKIIRELAEAGADLNATSSDGSAPEYVAGASGATPLLLRYSKVTMRLSAC